ERGEAQQNLLINVSGAYYLDSHLAVGERKAQPVPQRCGLGDLVARHECDEAVGPTDGASSCTGEPKAGE
ncbi:MAG: hypothetical protein VYE73_00695, partial [Acidobacteriota bacterium]|nr:hypothetical protein [Acidobacteriota bacterium]